MSEWSAGPQRAASLAQAVLRTMPALFRSFRPKAEAQFVEICHGDGRYRIAIRRVARARRLTLRIRAATLDAVLTMPPGGTLRAARTFAERHAAWVGDRLQALPSKTPFAVGSTIPFRGEELPILASSGLRAAAFLDMAIDDEGDPCRVLRVSGTPAEQHARVTAFLKGEARRDLETAVRRHAAAVGRLVSSVTLRDTRSRWGSCSSGGALSFSWRLVMAPPLVLDYLAAHEVAHLVHLDHSPAYWAVAGRLAPDLAAAEAWLRAHGPSLHRFGAAKMPGG